RTRRRARAFSLRGAHEQVGEPPIRVGPPLLDPISRLPGERLERRVIVLVRILSMDGLSLSEGERVAADVYALRAPADQMHLNAPLGLVVERAVPECREIEIAAELAVDAAEQVEVEAGGDAERVVVRRLENVLRFLEIRAEEEGVAGS